MKRIIAGCLLIILSFVGAFWVQENALAGEVPLLTDVVAIANSLVFLIGIYLILSSLYRDIKH